MAATWPKCSGATIFARPAADDIWTGPAQRAALRQMLGPEPEKCLLGPPSSGKSTLLRHVGSRLGDTVVLRCTGAKSSPGAILSSLLISADLAPWDLSEVEQRNLLTVFIQQRRAQGKRLALLFDDVQRYDPAARDELNRLRALHAADRLGHTLFMAGDASPGLDAAPAHGPTAVHELPAAGPDDIVEYLSWRLAAHALPIEITATAARLLHRFSAGRYAAVDVLFQMVLLLLKQTEGRRVDAHLIQVAAASLAQRHRGAASQPALVEPSVTAPAGPTPGELLITRDGALLDRRPLAAKVLIGRNEHNDICLASPHLSRHHAVIFGTAYGYYVADLNSANGVSVNGKRVTYAVLKNEDILSLGPFRLKFLLEHAHAPTDPLPGPRSLADTTLMSQPPDESRLVRRIK